MYRDYFLVNGKKYYTGTVFIVNNMGNQVEATFVCYDYEHSLYLYEIKGCVWRSGDKVFWRKFINVTNKKNYNVHIPVTRTRRDMDIDGLFLGWVWYIFLMTISIIFNDRIGLWILISVVFFSWRKKKIKEEGTYIEW